MNNKFLLIIFIIFYFVNSSLSNDDGLFFKEMENLIFDYILDYPEFLLLKNYSTLIEGDYFKEAYFYYLLSQIYYLKEDFYKSNELAQIGILLLNDIKNNESKLLKAKLFRNSNNVEKSFSILNSISYINNNDILLEKAYCYYRENKYEKSIDLLWELVENDNINLDIKEKALILILINNYSLNNFSKCIELFDIYLNDTKYISPYLYKGLCFLHLDKYGKSEKIFNNLLYVVNHIGFLEMKDVIYKDLAYLYFTQRKCFKIIELYNSLKFGYLLPDIGSCLFFSQEYQAAIYWLEKAIEHSYKDIELLDYLCTCYYKNDNMLKYNYCKNKLIKMAPDKEEKYNIFN